MTVKKKLRIRRYCLVSPKLRADQRTTLVFLTDAHNKLEGEDGRKLFAAIDECDPDLVLIGGDMILGVPGAPTAPVIGFLRELGKRYPVLYANGNHERRVLLQPEKFGDMGKELTDALGEIGIPHLINQTVACTAGNVPLTVYGMDPDGSFYSRKTELDMEKELSRTFGSPDQNRVTVLLAHTPKFCPSYLDWGADLTLCGHYHGGVFLLTEHRGLIQPAAGMLSPYCCGRFQRGTANVIVSAGLGEHTIPWRIRNPREVTCIEVTGIK